MNRKERWELFLNVIFERKSISKKELNKIAVENGINSMTFWRDYKEWINKQYIVEEFGVVKPIENADGEAEKGRTIKSKLNATQKERIARYAVNLIKEDSIIFIATGTTLEYLVKKISKPIKCLYTNGIEILKIASENKFIENIVIIGGHYNRRSHGVYGDQSIKQIEHISFDQAFTSATAVDKNNNVFNNTLGESNLLANIVQKGSKNYLLVDESKFNVSGVNFFANTKDFEMVITNISKNEIQITDNLIAI